MSHQQAAVSLLGLFAKLRSVRFEMAFRNFDSSPVDVKQLEKKTVKNIISGRLEYGQDPRLLFVEYLSSSVPTDNWTWLYKKERYNEWFITFKTIQQAATFADQGTVLVNDNLRLIVIPCSGEILGMRIHWLPASITKYEIAKVFEVFGEVQDVKEATTGIPELIDVRTGVREVTIRVTESDKLRIPHKLNIFGHAALVTFRGRPPLCLKCHEVGHIRSRCPYTPKPQPSRAPKQCLQPLYGNENQS